MTVIPDPPALPAGYTEQALNVMVQVRELGRTVDGFAFAPRGAPLLDRQRGVAAGGLPPAAHDRHLGGSHPVAVELLARAPEGGRMSLNADILGVTMIDAAQTQVAKSWPQLEVLADTELRLSFPVITPSPRPI